MTQCKAIRVSIALLLATCVVISSAPVLDVINDQAVSELQIWTFSVHAIENDTSAHPLKYSLVTFPSGMTIDPNTGLISWTPSEAQGPSTNTITVKVINSATPALSDTKIFNLVVYETNSTPKFSYIPDLTISLLSTLNLSATASDIDIPTNTLAYSLLKAPPGMTINPYTGVIFWTATEIWHSITNTVVIKVTDNGNPALSATNSFLVIISDGVNYAPQTVKLAWDPSSDYNQVAGYAMHWGKNSGDYIYTNIFTGTQTVASITGTLVAPLYFFAVRAFDTNGLHSDFSNEAIYTNKVIYSNESIYTNAMSLALASFNANLASTNNLFTYSTSNASKTIKLAWDPSPDSLQVVGHIMCWGSSSKNYNYFNLLPGTQTVANISGAFTAPLYYFAVKAFDSNGIQSDFSNEAIYTNSLQQTSLLSQQSSTTSTTTNNNPLQITPMSIQRPSQMIIIHSNMIGIPPEIVMDLQPPPALPSVKGIWGTFAAAASILSSTNPSNPNSWTAVTNFVFTNYVQLKSFTNSVYDIIDEAFAPAWQDWVLPQSYSDDRQFFKIAMPLDYPVLADIVLRARGYRSRLITIRMPGIEAYTVCYVQQSGAYIDCRLWENRVLLVPSGARIREIASMVAQSLQLNWTSATEFSFTNGVWQALATVVAVDDPSRDPVAGQEKSSIQINF